MTICIPNFSFLTVLELWLPQIPISHIQPPKFPPVLPPAPRFLCRVKALSVIYKPRKFQLSRSNHSNFIKVQTLYWVCITTTWRATLRDCKAGSLFLRHSHNPPPPIEISSSNDSSWQALKFCQRNPHPETCYYVVIAPPQGLHKFINFIVRRNGCYHNSFQAISRRWYFGSQPWVIPPPPFPLPPYGTLSNPLAPPHNFATMIGFDKASVGSRAYKIICHLNYRKVPSLRISRESTVCLTSPILTLHKSAKFR